MLMRSAITDTHWLGLKSLHRRENNGITGSQIYQEEVDGDAVDDYTSRLNGGVFVFWLIYRHLKRARERDTDIAY
jgi:hypothetical protein